MILIRYIYLLALAEEQQLLAFQLVSALLQ